MTELDIGVLCICVIGLFVLLALIDRPRRKEDDNE